MIAAPGASRARNVEPDVFIMRGSVLMIHARVDAQTMHAHRPIELILALDGKFTVRLYNEQAAQHAALIVGPMQRHAILRSDGPVARLYVDPGIRRLAGTSWRTLIGDLENDCVRQPLRDFYFGGRSVAAARDLAAKWKVAWLSGLEHLPKYDPRVVSALELVDEQVCPTANRASVAALASLSPSWFAALFKRETHMSFNNYIRWRRVLTAARLIRRGETLTSAALSVGFADAAHFSREYRKTFGVRPSWLKTLEIVPAPLRHTAPLSDKEAH